MNKKGKKNTPCIKLCIGGLLITASFVNAADNFYAKGNTPLTFKNAIKLAQANDPWLSGNRHQQAALESMSTAVNTLPDPKVSIGFSGIPTDSFSFSQEGMTQTNIGIAQVLPRGNSLAIKSQQLKTQSEAFPYQRQDREAQVAVTVGSLWLDAYGIQESIALIEKNRSLFEQLVDVAEVSYSSALGKARQQDVIRAQLELTRLENRLDKLAQQKNRYEGMLSQWFVNFSNENNIIASEKSQSFHNVTLSSELPKIDVVNRELVFENKWLQPQELVQYFYHHPAIIAVDKKVNATKYGVKLAEQKYKPEWGINANYGYRGNDPMGNNRADLFSIGVTFDLPIFTENRQDKEVQSAISDAEAVKVEKVLLLRQLLGNYSSTKGRLLKLKKSQHLYNTSLLPQLHEQAEAELAAYTSDDGDFSDVVRSRIEVLNAEIDQLNLNVEEQKLLLALNYLFVGSQQIAVSNNVKNPPSRNLTIATVGEK
ncbi:TolC family protein [Thalassotalea piscium]|uniref:Outer membrane protein TolC n=1 Tax=Thalassotalea piscium TaxID=1230533 RepID=A0A7X0NFS4_9GAMM|nr:TolC family protein [Thalassotalea piscium]MBB6542528.1 outer membrane protein TolC [Thalassotalea piscium]